jgi:nucleotide-binding universal stress UspA family protein
VRTGLGIELAAPVRYHSLAAAHPAEGILQATQSGEVDLVVVLARPRSFWGQLFHHNVTAQVLLHSTVPVLVLPTLT